MRCQRGVLLCAQRITAELEERSRIPFVGRMELALASLVRDTVTIADLSMSLIETKRSRRLDKLGLRSQARRPS